MADIERSKKVIQEWVDALRSGEYEQTKSALHHKDEHGERFCCLGVLCKLVKDDLNINVVEDGADRPGTPTTWFLYDTESGYLPEAVVQKLGVTPHVIVPVGVMGQPDATQPLTALNDSGFTFDQIADVIEWSFLS